MSQTEKNLTPEQMYKKNQYKAKLFKRLAPIVFWTFLGLSILFFILMIQNSVGNITEIISLLDKDNLTGEQIQNNYQYLVDKWGEWTIVGEHGGVFSIQFVDIQNAFFSGLMATFLTLGIVCLFISILCGKIILPKMAQYYTDNNQSMVDIATLQTHAEVTKKNKKESKEDWF